MIERYALYDIDKLRDQFNLAAGVPKGVKKRYNIVPAQSIPVILNKDGVFTMELMQWGFVSQNAKDTNSIFRYKTFAVRSEDTFKKTMWEKSVRTQRCLIPANGFYVWVQTPEGKLPYYVQVNDRPLVALAGVYSSWTNSEGVESGMAAIVTVPGDEATNEFTDHLPAIVHPNQEQMWLDPTVGDMASLYDVMRTTSFNSLSFTRVSDNIYSKKTDTPALILEV